tara:strand:+ start:175 stop:1194 length:1020 start_codon:yes stop_codon:yes gene_type:complete
MSSAVSMGTSIGGNVMGKKSAKKAKRRAQAGYDQATKTTTDTFGEAVPFYDEAHATAQEGLDNYADLGEGALGKLAFGLGFDVPGFDTSGLERGGLLANFSADKFEKAPGYEFRREEGQRGLERQASSKGGVLSGQTLKALNRFNQDYASNEYGAAYDRYNKDKTFQAEALSGVARMGQNAANQKGNWGMDYGRNRSNMVIDRGDKLAGLQLGRAGVGAQEALQKGRYAQNSMGAIGEGFEGMFDPGKGMMSGGGGGNAAGAVGGAMSIMSMFSDRKLKSNIERIGTHPLGIGIYKYLIFGDKAIGVMSDEVRKVMPEAVSVHKESGYDMVDYGMIGGV